MNAAMLAEKTPLKILPTMNNKYNANPFYLNPYTKGRTTTRQSAGDIFFAYQWEYRVYLELLKIVDAESIKPQYKVEIKPKTRVYPAICWRADFAIVARREYPRLLVEAKGFVTDDFKIRMKFLEYSHPDLWRIVAVVKDGASGQQIDSSHKKTLNLEALQDYLHHHLPLDL